MMKIAVTYEHGDVYQHFGHSSQFKLYDVEYGRLVEARIVDTEGQGHGALVSFLTSLGVTTVIAGGIGDGARKALADASIQLYGGVSGSADEAVKALLAGTLEFNPNPSCGHHGHEGGHHGHHEGPHHSHDF